MKASLVAYDYGEDSKNITKNSHRLSKKARNPNWVAQNFRGLPKSNIMSYLTNYGQKKVYQ
jgi:hypothetical protein